jgi:hypothetical protein
VANRLNGTGRSFANGLVRSGAINSGSWSFSGADGNKLLGPSRTNFANFGRHHLGRRTGTQPNTKQAFSFPFAKRVGGRSMIFTAAVRAIRSRAAQQNARDIFNAAGTLLNSINRRRKQEPQGESTPALDMARTVFHDLI